MYDIITIGSATQDVFLTSRDYILVPSKKFSTGVGECFAFGSKIEVKNIFFDTGGGATNTAVAFRNFGLKTAIITRVGDDAPGREIRSVLQGKGVDTAFIVATHKEHTAYSSILLTAMGERTVLVYRGASAHFSSQEIPWNRLRARWFYISSVGGNLDLLKKVFAHAKKNDIRIAWNPGGMEIEKGRTVLTSFIAQATILLLNREEAMRLSHPRPEGRQVVLVTDGKKGASLFSEGHEWYAPASRHKAVNATGAGDACGAGFVAGVIHGYAMPDALRVAILNSGSVVARMGAKNGLLKKMPLRSALQKLVVKQLT